MPWAPTSERVTVAVFPVTVTVTAVPTKLRVLNVFPTLTFSSSTENPKSCQSTPEAVDNNTCPLVPGSLFLSYNGPRILRPPLTSKLVVAFVVAIPTLPVTSSTV